MSRGVREGISTIKITGKNYENGINCSQDKLLIKSQGLRLLFENLIWLNSNEAAVYLRLPSVGALRVLVCQRRIPFYKLGRSLRFKKSELDRLLDASRNGGI